MVRKSTLKHRGSRMHGRGKKRGRGAGLRGGRGHAGSMGNKFVHYLKYEPDHFAHRHGFKRPSAVQHTVEFINVGELEILLSTFREDEIATGEGGDLTVDLAKAGFDKLLGAGKVGTALKVKIAVATPKAIEKIEAAGGSVEITE